MQMEIKCLQDEGTQVIKSLEEMKTEKQKNIDSLEEEKRKIQENIKSKGEKLKTHIDSLTTITTDTLNNNFTETKGALESEEKLITTTIDDTEKLKRQLQSVPCSDVAHQFIFMKLVKKSIAEAKKVKEKIEAKGTQVLKLNENTVFDMSILAGKDLGAVVVKSMNQRFCPPKKINIKTRREVNVKMKSDTKMCYITGVCQLQDGTVILTDYYNWKIKRLVGDYNVRDHCDLDSYPTDICCTDQNEVAVKMYSNKVHFIEVGKDLSKLREIAIEGGGYCGIVYVDKELWVSTGSGINVYSRSGELLKMIVKEIIGHNIFKKGVQRMALSEDIVIVTDYSNGAVCLQKDGKVKNELRDQRLSYTKGVCVSSDKIVFLSGYSSKNIIYFSSDGKYSGELTRKKDDMHTTYPGCMWYDNNWNCIILANETSTDFIHILEISH